MCVSIHKAASPVGLLCDAGSSPLCWELWDGLGGAREVQGEGHRYTRDTTPWWCMAKTSTIL